METTREYIEHLKSDLAKRRANFLKDVTWSIARCDTSDVHREAERRAKEFLVSMQLLEHQILTLEIVADAWEYQALMLEPKGGEA